MTTRVMRAFQGVSRTFRGARGQQHVVPEVVRNKAVAAGAGWWLDELPELVASLEREWSIVVGRRFDDATEGFVAEAVLADGTPAVLKLLVPGGGGVPSNEIAFLRRVNGEGCARLIRDDPFRGAMLLERLGRTLYDLDLPTRRRHEIMSSAAADLWRPAASFDLPTGADKGRCLVDEITRNWNELDRPCSERAVDHALTCAGRRVDAHDDEQSVLVHGDVHQWNVLEAGGGFKLVDPEGLFVEPEYDLGIIMREDALELMHGDPFERARWLAALSGLDATAIWEWGVVQRVSAGLFCTTIGLQPIGREILTVAEQVADSRIRTVS